MDALGTQDQAGHTPLHVFIKEKHALRNAIGRHASVGWARMWRWCCPSCRYALVLYLRRFVILD
jgi:hypothetical protein